MNATLRICCVLLAAIFIPLNTYAASSITVIATDNDGQASGLVYLHKEKAWLEDGAEKRDFVSFSNARLKQGAATFAVPAGKYRVVAYYSETLGPDTSKTSEAFLVADEEEVTREFYFEKGSINVVAQDHDGEGSGVVYLRKAKLSIGTDDNQQVFESFASQRLDDGAAIFTVPPGTYRLVVYYDETAGPDLSKTSEPFQVADTDAVVKTLYFEKGRINVVGKDSEKWTSALVYLYQEKMSAMAEAGFESVTSRRMKGGTATFAVPPGRYRLVVYYSETAGPDLSVTSATFLVADNEEVTIEL